MRNSHAKSLALAVLAVSAVSIANAQSVKGTVALPGSPEQVAVNPFTNRIFVAVPNFGAEPFDFLTVVDGKTDTVVKNIQIPPVAFAVAVNPANNRVYVGGSFQDDNGVTQNEVVAVDPTTEKVLKTISISTTPGNGIQGLAVNILNGDVYVTNGSDNEVDVIRNLQVKDRIAVSGEPFGIAVNPVLNKIYVALQDGNVSIIDGESKKITVTTPFGASDAGIAVDLANGNVFTANSVGNPGTVGVLSAAGSVQATVPVGSGPFGIDVDFLSGLTFVANSQSGTVSAINANSDVVTSTLPVSALFLAANPVTGKVYVAPASNATTLTVISEK